MATSGLTNVVSLNAQLDLAALQSALAESIGKLSTSMRTTTAGGAAADLGISENLKAGIRSLAQVQRNTNDGISMSQVAEGAMDEMLGIVSRMRELAVEAANVTVGSTERGYIQSEFGQLAQEIDRIGAVTDYNGQKLLDGSASSGLIFQVGIHDSSSDKLSLSITRLTTSTLGSASLHIASASLSTASKAATAISVFDKAIQQLTSARAKVGAAQNRMQVTVSNLSTMHEGLSAASPRVRGVDVATAPATMARSRAGLAVLSQTDQLPALVDR